MEKFMGKINQNSEVTSEREVLWHVFEWDKLL